MAAADQPDKSLIDRLPLAQPYRRARVQDARIARRLTQAQLGDACRLHRTFIGSVERGERNVAILSLRRIAASLRMPLADLLAGAPRS
jgi:transcriptional regulator with XRE-family HTH domain